MKVSSAGDTEWLNRLLAFINDIRGIDFARYRHATIARKLDGRMEETGKANYRDYLEYLRSQPDELDNLIRALTIKVSTFFRNPLVFEILASSVLPDLVGEFGYIKAWSLGCAHGQEPYSIAMIAHDLISREKPIDVKILGTDVCDGAMERSFAGIYPESELAEVKKKFMDCFFEKLPYLPETRQGQEVMYRVNNEIKSMVQMECGDIFSKLKYRRAKRTRYNLILCRNVLIYMNTFLQWEVVQLIADILQEGGYLVIGESETLPAGLRSFFAQPFPGVKIYRKKGASQQSVGYPG